jgi:predicted MFS family arabinose efflux permease
MGAILEASVLAPLHASWRWIYAASLPVALVLVALRRALPESSRYERLVASGHPHGSVRALLAPPHRRMLLLIGGTVAIANLTTQATVFAVDYLQTERHLGASAANLVLVAAGTVCLPVLVGSGRWSDRWGRRPVCAVALVIQAVGVTLFFNVGSSTPVLFAMLAVTYLGVFGAWTTGSAFGVEAFPTALRATAGAAVTLARLAGQCASFVVSAVLLRSVGHAGLIVGLLSIGPVVAAVLVATTFPETRGQELEDDASPVPVVPDQLLAVDGVG